MNFFEGTLDRYEVFYEVVQLTMKDFWHGKLDMNHGKLDMKHGKLHMNMVSEI